MMPVQQQPEPADFDKRVRTLGKKFLDTNPNLNGKDAWKNKEYWRDEKSFNDLCDAYNNLCAYTGIWIPIPPNGSRSVDHFIPKSIVPEQAYEWSNFRLTSQRMNTWKGIHQDILDPFQIDDNLFFLDFSLLEVKPNPRLSQELQSAILTTTERLKLNHHFCVSSREVWLNDYCFLHQSLSFLEVRAPFIAHELKRQDLTQKIIDIWKRSRESRA